MLSHSLGQSCGTDRAPITSDYSHEQTSAVGAGTSAVFIIASATA